MGKSRINRCQELEAEFRSDTWAKRIYLERLLSSCRAPLRVCHCRRLIDPRAVRVHLWKKSIVLWMWTACCEYTEVHSIYKVLLWRNPFFLFLVWIEGGRSIHARHAITCEWNPAYCEFKQLAVKIQESTPWILLWTYVLVGVDRRRLIHTRFAITCEQNGVNGSAWTNQSSKTAIKYNNAPANLQHSSKRKFLK